MMRLTLLAAVLAGTAKLVAAVAVLAQVAHRLGEATTKGLVEGLA
jgi:hypothetical protein